ncbi:MAG: GNAT family N-acetyltransferase [Winogradskyella sp.]|uniref:GNAT family N-acetyltransferase n=1 Tax=Winogradskyella sp. TaxID=1883156 RepID=UPI0017A23144|nr:GNAT family N-acetyltransferase [Winogradskyella sp.]
MEVNTIIETERLILRPVKETDIDDFFELDSNPNVYVYLGRKPVTTIKQSEEMVAGILQQYKEFGIGRLAIVKKDTNDFIGWSGLKYEQNLRADFNYYDIGYRLKEQFWGNGYATEAALASIDYGFNGLDLKEICAAAEIEHKVSNAILNKIGMQKTETFIYNNKLLNWYTIRNLNETSL